MELVTHNKQPSQWFAVHTKSRTEKKVFDRLQIAGHESFLPMKTEIRQWSDRKKKVRSPLIKSYVFVRVKQNDLTPIYTIPGVVTVLTFLGKPAVVTDVEINNLKIVTNNSDAIKEIKPFNLTNGKPVQVVQGPFKGLIAVYLSNSGKHRVIVEVEALNSFTEITLPLSHIKEL